MKREEAIQILRTQYPHDAVIKEALGLLIPELRESEDERIRKGLIEVVSDIAGSWPFEEHKITKKEALAYLEKQKEITPADGWEYADKRMSHPLYLEGFEAGRAVERELSEFEKQKEQKPALEQTLDAYKISDERATAKMEGRIKGRQDVINNPEEYGLQKLAEWSEDYNEDNLQTRFAFYTYKDDPSTLYLSNVFVEEASRNHGFGTHILKAAEKVAETVGAITIRLKVKQDSPANNWYRKHGYAYMTLEDGYDWLEKSLEYIKTKKSIKWGGDDELMIESLIAYLKGTKQDFISNDMVYWLESLPERFNLQPKQEWSEEDELMRTAVIQTLKMFGGRGTTEMQIDWLKSLRPQPHWKPSEEQMDRLFSIIVALRKDYCDDMADFLASLYKQLKKLM